MWETITQGKKRDFRNTRYIINKHEFREISIFYCQFATSEVLHWWLERTNVSLSITKFVVTSLLDYVVNYTTILVSMYMSCEFFYFIYSHLFIIDFCCILQVLVTGSLHLIGDVLKLIKKWAWINHSPILSYNSACCGIHGTGDMYGFALELQLKAGENNCWHGLREDILAFVALICNCILFKDFVLFCGLCKMY